MKRGVRGVGLDFGLQFQEDSQVGASSNNEKQLQKPSFDTFGSAGYKALFHEAILSSSFEVFQRCEGVLERDRSHHHERARGVCQSSL